MFVPLESKTLPGKLVPFVALRHLRDDWTVLISRADGKVSSSRVTEYPKYS